jgi:hypothetical protein
MIKQTLYIILIILLFNFLLINIFRLQDEIIDIRDKKNILLGLLDNKKYKDIDDNSNISVVEVKEKMNEIAELVPIDFNKIVESKEKFIPKDKQV